MFNAPGVSGKCCRTACRPIQRSITTFRNGNGKGFGSKCTTRADINDAKTEDEMKTQPLPLPILNRLKQREFDEAKR